MNRQNEYAQSLLQLLLANQGLVTLIPLSKAQVNIMGGAKQMDAPNGTVTPTPDRIAHSLADGTYRIYGAQV